MGEGIIGWGGAMDPGRKKGKVGEKGRRVREDCRIGW